VETVYISEVNGARKVKSNKQVAMNKNSDAVQKFFPLGAAGEDSDPNSNFTKLLKLPETSQARKLILGQQAKPTVADMTLLGRRYIWGPAKIYSPHISEVHILRNQVQVLMYSI